MSRTPFNHTRHKLMIRHLKAPLDVLVFEGHERLSEPFRYTIEFTSPVLDIDPAQVLSRGASLSLYPEPIGYSRLRRWDPLPPPVPLHSIYGQITEFRHLSTSQDEARYEVVLEPGLAVLAHGKQYRLYQNQSVPEIVEHILRSRHRFRGHHFKFDLIRKYPDREQVMQFGESDLAFIQRILAEVGIWYYHSMDERLGQEVVEFCDDARGYVYPTRQIPAVPPSGMTLSADNVVWHLQARHALVTETIKVRAYDPRNAREDLDSHADLTRGLGGEQRTTYGEGYHYGDPYTEVGNRFVFNHQLAPESGYFYARLHHERYLNHQTRLSGTCLIADLIPAQTVQVTGDVPAAFAERIVITAVTRRAARHSGLLITFEAIPHAYHYSFRPDVPPKPVMAGTIPGRIAADRSPVYAHLNQQGHYRVRFLFDRDEWPHRAPSAWLRLARPYAGKTYGLHLPLIEGTEVAIAFEHGDPDRPYIAHALHDSEHLDPVTLKNRQRNVLRTPANNKLRMEDERGQEHVKLSCEHGGKSQLNLGHVVNAEKQKRGEGFELRTDSWGAIRGGKGVFISADPQPLAQGPVLEMADAADRLQQAHEQMQHVSQSAAASGADPADLHAQMTLLNQKVEQLQAAVLLLSAPDGIAVTSGQHLQLAARHNLMANAGGHADIGVVKRMFMGIGQGLSVFVHKVGIKLIANQGPIKLQAQNDTLELLARNALQITSTEDEIHITAKKKIVLNAGGSYLIVEGPRIEMGTEGDLNLKASRFEYSGGVSMRVTHPEYPEAVSRQGFRFKVQPAPNVSGTGWAGMPYTLLADGVAVGQGVLDNKGQVRIDHQIVTRQYSLQLANGMTFQLPIPDDYRNVEQGLMANLGLRNHPIQPNPGVNSLNAHSEHRTVYETALENLSDPKGDAR